MEREELLDHEPLVIAGPCSVASRDQILRIATEAKNAGANVIKAMLWKPRTDPDSFQGVQEEGIDWLIDVKKLTNLPITTEVMSVQQMEMLKDIVDIFWIGSRNMQNFDLLRSVGSYNKPVILKRGLISTIKEWVGAARYIGLDKVIMCERGIRTGADSMRFTLDLNAMLVVKHDHKLPVLVDPSHTAGRRDMVPSLSLAAIAAGADGLVIETHYDPEAELVDKDQTISTDTLRKIISDSRKIRSMISL
jgi:3-deoxy-7-phosphoheptulonate synthase